MATILIVDDRESNRELLTTLLGYRNHRTVEACDGLEGLERARVERPDLVITDILMPTMDGYEFTRRLRADGDLASVPVVFYSAHYLMQEAHALAAKCGVEYVLAKPAEPEEVLRIVDAALGLAPTTVPAPPVEEFDREHIRVLTDKLSQQAGEVGNLSARLEALIDVGHELNVAQDPTVLLERYCQAAREVIGATCSAACITDESGQAARRYCSGRVEPTDPMSPCPTCGLGGAVSEILSGEGSQRGRNWPDKPVMPGCQPEIGPLGSYLVVPILTRNRTYGWLGLGNKLGADEFGAGDERLLTTLAAQLAVGYENSRLFEELKQRAEELEHEVVERRHAAEKYRMVVEQASDGIAIADERGDCLEVNARLLEMLGYTREEFLGRNMQDLIPSGDRSSIPWSVDAIRGRIFRKELRFLRKDGTFLEVEVSMSGLEDGRIQAIIRDVAERKRLEMQLRQSQKLEAVGRLAGGVAHDFNNLLTVILGHSDMVLAAMDPHDGRRRDIEDVRDAGARAAVLTNQLLAFSRKQVLQPKIVNVSDAVASLTKMLGRLINSNIELVTRPEKDTWLTKVDPGQLDQVILNLVLNARDAMPLGGKLLLETENQKIEGQQIVDHPEVPPGEYVMLSVSDTGSGMDAETRSHLFEPFFTTKALGKGTGLGLSTVYGIVRQSGGYIWVYSEPNRGTIVKVYLPRAAGQTEVKRPRNDYQPLPLGSETVLLAEDDERVRRLTASVLGQLGYTVLEAADGEEALGAARQYEGEIHLLFTDIVMPKKCGNEIADEIRQDRPGIKVLFSSGYTGDVVAQQGALDPTIPFLQKPFTPRTLAVKVREALDGSAEGVWPDGKGSQAERLKRNDPGVSHSA
jgi:PAS domain S-box-containing protein